jgi:hypothetical protein
MGQNIDIQWRKAVEAGRIGRRVRTRGSTRDHLVERQWFCFIVERLPFSCCRWCRTVNRQGDWRAVFLLEVRT